MTHHHRDQAQGLARAAAAGARIHVPAAERDLFGDVGEMWRGRALHNDYNLRQDRFSLLEPVPVHDVVPEYRTRTYAGTAVEVLPTPGHTTGSTSYVIERDGRRLAFTGDLIYAPGKVWSLAATQWSYVDNEGPAMTVLSALQLAGCGLDLLLPSHGEPMDEPEPALRLLAARARGRRPRGADGRGRAVHLVRPDPGRPAAAAGPELRLARVRDHGARPARAHPLPGGVRVRRGRCAGAGHRRPAGRHGGDRRRHHFALVAREAEEQERLHRELLPLDDLAIGPDGVVARVTPYYSRAEPRTVVRLGLRVRNPFDAVRKAVVRTVLPVGWVAVPDEAAISLPPLGQELMEIEVTTGGPCRRARLAVDVTVGELRLGQHAEAVIDVRESA
ncbi:MBL fold metallo-hydrolase [Actinoplanes sp. CA-030573]|uniref:MBL fold metallo-hydrolase n=1 Tax=Actinoplanes sp. CA-030573 TaxID=3239898 RepID=UPI003D8C012D